MRHDPGLAKQAKLPATTPAAAPGDGPDTPLALVRYRVTHFRSVKDSGWLDLGRITALVGVNESGKTNLLLPLWKLNPVIDGGLDPVSDYPKSLFGEIRAAPAAYRFILAEFDTGQAADHIAELARIPPEAARRVAIGRLFDGSYTVDFPNYERPRRTETATVVERLRVTRDQISACEVTTAQATLKADALGAIDTMLDELPGDAEMTGNDMLRLRNRVGAIIPEDPPATSEVVRELRALQSTFGRWMSSMLAPDPGQIDTVREAVLSRMPSFVFYSSLGNLDSEIYLPHVVDNMARADIGAKDAAKVRTLRMLFGFVGLEPAEILELGRDFRDVVEEAERLRAEELRQADTLDRIKHWLNKGDKAAHAALMDKVAEAKRMRSILLQSAGTRLGERFAEWWRVRDYRFRFEADGNHFRIWVSDSERPQEVELEERSTGLQWFLSFFLVFLHESRGLHRRAILLLDEPGLSLHPLAQRDLSAFFDEIARAHQIVYTAHSPFLIDADRLERARKVYVGEDGSTRVTSDLCAAEGKHVTEGGAAYAVRTAVNMAVAEASFGGADVVLVPGQVEQTHLAAIKSVLIGAGAFAPKRDILFAPAGDPGVAVRMVEVLAGRRDQTPAVLLNESTGGSAETPLTFAHFIGRATATVEDVMPTEVLAELLDRMERRPEVMFADLFRADEPFVPQAEAWAAKAGIDLHPDWRLDLARRMRDRLMTRGADLVPAPTRAIWRDLLGACLDRIEVGSGSA